MTAKPKLTQWGALLLIENPPKPVTQGFDGPVCDKVPRVINLRGKVSQADASKPALVRFDFDKGSLDVDGDLTLSWANKKVRERIRIC